MLRSARVRLESISQTPQLDAELLLAHVLVRERSYLHAYPEAALSASQQQSFDALIKRRARGEPLAYILGVKEFWSLPLRVNTNVLIPRPETELLVELALKRIPEHVAWEIADLGTGSGAIALAIARERPQCTITATDISPAALGIAAGNASRLNIRNVRFVQGHWLTPLRGRFHILVSNPPYVAADDPHLHRPELQFEPRQALVSAEDGLHDLALMARNAGAVLHDGGWLIVEHSPQQAPLVRDLFARHGFRDVETVRDLAGHERATAGAHGSA